MHAKQIVLTVMLLLTVFLIACASAAPPAPAPTAPQATPALAPAAPRPTPAALYLKPVEATAQEKAAFLVAFGQWASPQNGCGMREVLGVSGACPVLKQATLTDLALIQPGVMGAQISGVTVIHGDFRLLATGEVYHGESVITFDTVLLGVYDAKTDSWAFQYDTFATITVTQPAPAPTPTRGQSL